MPSPKPATVDAYIAAQPDPIRPLIQSVREAIRTAVPKAEESIAYQMPAYKLDGRPMLYFAAWKKHYSLYPAGPELAAQFEKELRPYGVEKGTIRLPYSDPPLKLIAAIARFRARQTKSEAKSKSA